jgi:casein kinase 1
MIITIINSIVKVFTVFVYRLVMIANKYKVVDKLTNGAFGTIYKAQNIRTYEHVAIKLELKNSQSKSLKNEAKIYQYLGKLEGFPQLKWFGSTDKITYLVIDLLGVSLSKMIHVYTRLSLKTTLFLGIQIIKIIQSLHDRSLLHRDIKPENLLFGLSHSTNKLHLIDFGFTKRYSYDGKHIDETKIGHIIGSPCFVSLNIHRLIEPSRRDDLESCIYVIISMLYGQLDWATVNDYNEMAVLKTYVSHLPIFIQTMLTYVRGLTFTETPNYNYLINILISTYESNSFINDGNFEWS